MRYGFAIEGNKYDHVWLSYDLGSALQGMPDLFQRVKKLGLSLRKKFKINHTKLNLDLIIFHRLLKWNLYNIRNLKEIFCVSDIHQELEILEAVRISLEHKLKIFQGAEDLSDTSLNYHRYFIAVFHVEHARILKKQISLVEKLKKMLKQLEKGFTIEKASG